MVLSSLYINLSLCACDCLVLVLLPVSHEEKIQKFKTKNLKKKENLQKTKL
jgi:hypothetical protein